MLKQSSRVRTTMWGPEKDNARSRFVDAAKMTLVHFTTMGSPKSFFYNDASEAMGDKQQQP